MPTLELTPISSIVSAELTWLLDCKITAHLQPLETEGGHMTEPKTSRPFQERFLDGFDRSQLRQEVQKVKPRKLSGLRR